MGDGADRFAEAIVRRRWWAYRSKVEHPEDNESIEYGVPFVRVQSQPEPQEYSFSHRKRRPDGATSLPVTPRTHLPVVITPGGI